MSQQACQRPGCTGSYEDVGGGELYCDTCGLAPVVSANGMVGSSPTGIAGASPGLGGSQGASGASAGHAPGSADSSGRTSQPSSAGSARSATSRRSVSGRLSRTLAGAATARSVSVRSSGTATGASGRGRLGAGLVKVPEVPRPDPRSMVLERAEVPERKRFCSRTDCGAPVGRSRGGRPGRTEGFCTKCGHPYSFVPKLRPGDIVHGQYEVAGCLAHGGLGWIYLAVDRAVSDRWVVLKGLLDTGDQDAMAAAISERRFLAEIEHSNIVRIYNFVEHLDTRTGSMDGYIVMEYVGGKSLKDIANGRRTPEGRRDPLAVDQACAYGIEALEALGHLHSRNLLYCDFKVDNAIQTEDQLKLIDMGAVRRMDDEESAIFGTVGYQAPEVAEAGPSVASDLYTVARTLAVLTFDFQGYTNVFVDSLPDPDNIDVFRRYESFYRLLVRATDPDPARRFASAQEMAEQLTGVLREVVALQTGRPRPALSSLFGPELKVTDTELFKNTTTEVSRLGTRALPESGRTARNRPATGSPATAPPLAAAPSPGLPGAGLPPAEGHASYAPLAPAPGGHPQGTGAPNGAPGALPAPAPATAHGASHGTPPLPAPEAVALAGSSALALPVPRIDPNDPNAGFLAGLLASAPSELISALRAAPVDSPERRLCELRARLAMGELGQAGHILDALERDHPDDWRVIWYRGVVSLTTGDHAVAALSFDAVYDAFPGEPAPKIALGVCAEVLGQLDNAAEYYRLVWTTDPSYVSAAFGLARVRFAAGDRRGAVETLESVPESSIHYTAARVAAVRARLRQRLPVGPVSGGGIGSNGTAGLNDPGGAPHNAMAAGADASFLGDLMAAADQVQALDAFGLDAVRRELLSTEVLGTALDWVLSGNHGSAPPHGGGRPVLLGSELDERGLRFGLERSYRTLARLANSGKERIELVERANRLRPRTWV
ncbi:serine/threonine-protein kinase [Streptomyces odontomachi]|uniref:serine/threonine-protein kinase n=1 Tax=Streptomyces odontomachi TaxID=2944940 RepID=UPI00210D264F|nr:serine/threonine-protein kinase [Streptomyces sp. ODS25]